MHMFGHNAVLVGHFLCLSARLRQWNNLYCGSDAVLDPEHDGLREAVEGLQLGEAGSEQGSTAGTAAARHPEDVPPLRSSSAGIKREDLLSSVPDDIKSSVPKDTIEGVQVCAPLANMFTMFTPTLALPQAQPHTPMVRCSVIAYLPNAVCYP